MQAGVNNALNKPPLRPHYKRAAEKARGAEHRRGGEK